MIRDVKSSYVIAEAVQAQTIAAGTENGVQVDHSLGNSASYFVSVGAITGTVDMKIEHSEDGSSWVDDNGESGNDTSITQITASGTAQLNVVNPQARYSRAVVTVGGTSAVASVTSVMGPLRTITPNDL